MCLILFRGHEQELHAISQIYFVSRSTDTVEDLRTRDRYAFSEAPFQNTLPK